MLRSDGNWSVWGAWSACSVTCGSGQKTRRRACNNPAPSNGGQQCLGDDVESGSCMTTVACPVVDGGWSEYGPWSVCSKSCGGGERYRERTCTNPSPVNGGKTCDGIGMQSETCNAHAC
ncbi:predicted protein, partial [Nematostella vectensis]